jgi:hypothetical protein
MTPLHFESRIAGFWSRSHEPNLQPAAVLRAHLTQKLAEDRTCDGPQPLELFGRQRGRKPTRKAATATIKVDPELALATR